MIPVDGAGQRAVEAACADMTSRASVGIAIKKQRKDGEVWKHVCYVLPPNLGGKEYIVSKRMMDALPPGIKRMVQQSSAFLVAHAAAVVT